MFQTDSFKFVLVGTSGTVVNLGVLLSLVLLSGVRDWRVSGLANLCGNLRTYMFNNAWTFVDRVRRGWSALRGYASYLGFSMVGICASTLAFASLSHVQRSFLHVIGTARESNFLALAGC